MLGQEIAQTKCGDTATKEETRTTATCKITFHILIHFSRCIEPNSHFRSESGEMKQCIYIASS